MISIERSIFVTNVFAEAYPDVHVKLWEKFEQEVPVKNRSGYYGADNVAYVSWLKKEKNPVFSEFLQKHIELR